MRARPALIYISVNLEGLAKGLEPPQDDSRGTLDGSRTVPLTLPSTPHSLPGVSCTGCTWKCKPANPNVTSHHISGCRPWQRDEGSGVLCLCLPAVVCRRDPYGTRMCSKAKQGCKFSLEPLSTLRNVSIAAAAASIKPESVSF